ncbi:hypothetical protein [Vagococcus fluvialis]|uniref:hypothetical protein n=1 Tax=Vagococcus fluvialis TaxID=2738 RepID=UPI001A8EA9A0|nr:hypothetical protein [Vagococcus fluvialis]MBO0436830.1 hypothetical protein [Vagococcus fluvialis]
MCWNNNKQSIIASIMIFSSLMIFTIFNESTYTSTAFTVASILQVSGILLMLHNMFIRKKCTIKPKKNSTD